MQTRLHARQCNSDYVKIFVLEDNQRDLILLSRWVKTLEAEVGGISQQVNRIWNPVPGHQECNIFQTTSFVSDRWRRTSRPVTQHLTPFNTFDRIKQSDWCIVWHLLTCISWLLAVMKQQSREHFQISVQHELGSPLAACQLHSAPGLRVTVFCCDSAAMTNSPSVPRLRWWKHTWKQ